jgi:hypothetical protein
MGEKLPPIHQSHVPEKAAASDFSDESKAVSNQERVEMLKQLLEQQGSSKGAGITPDASPSSQSDTSEFVRPEYRHMFDKNCLRDNRVPTNSGNSSASEAIHQVGEDVGDFGNDVSDGIRSGADAAYKNSRMQIEADDWLITRGLKHTANFLGDVGHTGAYMVSQAPMVAGQAAKGVTQAVADPQGTVNNYIDEHEDSRKAMRKTFEDNGASGAGAATTSALLSYFPGLKDMAEGGGNVSLTDPEQTLQRQQNPDMLGNISQFSGGLSATAGTIAGGLKAPNTLRNVKTRITGKPDLPNTRGPDFWKNDDFMGGKIDDSAAVTIRKELQDEIDGMGLSPNEIAERGMERGLTGLNNAPDEWMPKYHRSGKHAEAFADVWGTRSSTNTAHAAEAATMKLDQYKASMANGEVATGKLHWSQYGDTPKAAVHSLRRLSKTYSLMEGKVTTGNPTARARAAIFDTLADWAEKTEGLAGSAKP